MTNTVEGGRIDPALRDELRERLEHERASLLGHQEIDPSESALEPDDAVAAQEVELALETIGRSTLAELDLALQRLESGTYGQCLDCGSSIPVERLEIMPAARYCVGCQQRNE